MLKVKVFLYFSGDALRVPGGWSSQISWQSVYEGGKVVSRVYRPCLPIMEIFPVLISVRGWVELMDVVRPEGLYQWKIPMISTGIEPATFRLVAQCLNHRVPRNKSSSSSKQEKQRGEKLYFIPFVNLLQLCPDPSYIFFTYQEGWSNS